MAGDVAVVSLAALVVSSAQLALSVSWSLLLLPGMMLGSSPWLEPAVSVALSVDVPPEAVAAMSSLASVAELVVAPLGGCGRCSRPGGTDARPLRATQ